MDARVIHTPGYHNPKGDGKISGVHVGAYFFAQSELEIMVSGEWVLIADMHYYDDNHKGVITEDQRMHADRVKSTFDLLAELLNQSNQGEASGKSGDGRHHPDHPDGIPDGIPY